MTTLTANISGEKHDRDNQETAFLNYEGFPTSLQNFMNVGSLTATNRTLILPTL